MALFSTLCLCSILLLVSRLLHKLWWKPIQTQKFLRSQGINGPTYRFLHGNTKEILEMKKEALSTPYELTQHDVFPRVFPHLNAWNKLYGKNFLIWIGTQPQIVVTEPELVKEILMSKEGIYKKAKPNDFLKRILGDGLVLTEGEKWSKLRKLSNFAFHGESLKDMVPSMVASMDTMMERLGAKIGQEIDISKEFKLLTSDIISRTAFGSCYVEGQNIFNTLEKLTLLLTRNAFKIRPFGLKRIWRSKDEVEADRVEQSLIDSILSLVKQREDMVRTKQSDTFGSDFLGALMRVNHELDPKVRISVQDIIDECKVFFVAGHETSSSLLSWTALLLSIHQEWQEKAREEVVRIFGKTDKPTADGLSKLKTLAMILNEALRLYSPVVSFNRRVEVETRLGSYTIPANVELNAPPLALHRSHEIWGDDAHLFKPERFGDGVAKATNGNSAGFVPFGLGPRACVGLNFAAHEAKIALSMILQRYKLTLSPNYVHAPFQLLTVNPQFGIQIILHSV